MKSLVRLALHQFGGLETALLAQRSRFRILTYHRFASHLVPDVEIRLREQFSFLKDHFHLVSMDEISEALVSGRPLRASSLAITVDDGYRDILTDAFPVASSLGIPFTVYLATGFVDRQCWMWWDQVEYCLKRTSQAELRARLSAGAAELVLPLEDLGQRARAVERLCEELKLVTNDDRIAFINGLDVWTGVELPEQAPPEYAALSWDEARQLKSSGLVSFGGHTRSHPILSRIASRDLLDEQICSSAESIEKELGYRPLHFAYPNGRSQDIGKDAMKAVQSCGFLTAVTTSRGLNRQNADRHSLKRLSISPSYPQRYFRETVAALTRG